MYLPLGLMKIIPNYNECPILYWNGQFFMIKCTWFGHMLPNKFGGYAEMRHKGNDRNVSINAKKMQRVNAYWPNDAHICHLSNHRFVMYLGLASVHHHFRRRFWSGRSVRSILIIRFMAIFFAIIHSSPTLVDNCVCSQTMGKTNELPGIRLDQMRHWAPCMELSLFPQSKSKLIGLSGFFCKGTDMDSTAAETHATQPIVGNRTVITMGLFPVT